MDLDSLGSELDLVEAEVTSVGTPVAPVSVVVLVGPWQLPSKLPRFDPEKPTDTSKVPEICQELPQLETEAMG